MNNPFKEFATTLSIFINEQGMKELPLRWNERHRKYHNVTHLQSVIFEISKNAWFTELNAQDKIALLLAAFFHDVIYDPKSKNNEDLSIAYFIHCYKANNQGLRDKVCKLIETTKHRKRPNTQLEKIFWDADNAQFKKSYESYSRIEKQIREEFSFVPRDQYKKARLEFLESCIGLFGADADKNLLKIMEYIERTY